MNEINKRRSLMAAGLLGAMSSLTIDVERGLGIPSEPSRRKKKRSRKRRNKAQTAKQSRKKNRR